MSYVIHEGESFGAYSPNINPRWQRHSMVDDSPINLLPVGYIAGYKLAADMLMSQHGARDATLDMTVYPILFLYRQYIELILKITYMNHHNKADSKDMIKNCGHNLGKLFALNERRIFDIVKENIQATNHMMASELTDVQAVTEFETMKAVIYELNKYDNNSFHFRYFFNKDLSDTFVKPLTVDLLALKDFVQWMDTYFYAEYAC